MSEWLRLAIALAAAVNPAAVAATAAAAPPGRIRLRTIPAAAALALAIIAAAAALAGRILDGLDIEPETFRIAAGMVMATMGVLTLWRGNTPATIDEWPGGWRAAVFPLALPLLLGPATLIAALSYSADHGAARTASAAAVGLVVASLLVAIGFGGRRVPAEAVARLTGALLVAIATGLVVDGVRAI
ncbi:MAG: hypothetical protein HYX53_10750 [Chloroflexi bacterium]|nr:hypothetical protein [Chloroflexota bacterium]